MRRALWVGTVAASMLALGVAARGEMTPAIKTLVEAERAFSAASVAKGQREAFLEFLADDSLLFRPGPVPGKMFHRTRPSPPGTLAWAPIFADVAASGEIGYTVGPWEFRKGAITEAPTGWGHYVSVWRKQKDGSWKVEVDLGVSHEKFTPAVADIKEVGTPAEPPNSAPARAAAAPEAVPASPTAPAGKPAAKPGELKPAETPKAGEKPKPAEAPPADVRAGGSAPPQPARQAPGATSQGATPGTTTPAAGPGVTPPAPLSPAKQAEEALKEADRAFAKAATDGGVVKAYAAVSSTEVRVYRNGSLPVIGKAALEKLQPAMLGSTWQPTHARVSTAGDFGYTTGMIAMAPAAPGAGAKPQYYVRIWRRDKAGVWKVQLDIVT